jgi:c-di-GMP-binding flagellar brake protein YcgR
MFGPKVGERVIVEVPPSRESYPGEVVIIDDASMGIAPAMRGAELPELGTAIRITFVRKDGLYELQGAVTATVSSPEVRVTIQLAGDVSRTQRRDFVRRDASLNADITVQGHAFHCMTKDVSGGGVSVLFGEVPPLVEGEAFEVLLNVPDGRQPIQAQCKSKYVREVLRGSRWLVGSQFSTIAEEDRQRLVRFVFRLELAQKRPVGKK